LHAYPEKWFFQEVLPLAERPILGKRWIQKGVASDGYAGFVA
jgi:hypothetical protein